MQSESDTKIQIYISNNEVKKNSVNKTEHLEATVKAYNEYKLFK